MPIIRQHQPVPNHLSDTQRASLAGYKPTVGLGDRVEVIAKPIARLLNRLAPKVLAAGKWMETVGQPGSSCGCQKRKKWLNHLDLQAYGLEFPQHSGNPHI